MLSRDNIRTSRANNLLWRGNRKRANMNLLRYNALLRIPHKTGLLAREDGLFKRRPGIPPCVNKVLLAPLILLLFGTLVPQAGGQRSTFTDVRVQNADGLRQAIAQAKPGTRILLAPGAYRGSFFFSNLHGAP